MTIAAVAAIATFGLLLAIPSVVHPALALADLVLVFALVTWTCDTRSFVVRSASRARREQQVRLYAEAEFHREAVHATPRRTGLLVYVSAAENRVELVPDVGIEARIPRAAWLEATAQLSASDLELFLTRAGRDRRDPRPAPPAGRGAGCRAAGRAADARMSWVDAVPLPVRVPLIAGSIAVLGAGTVGLGILGLEPSVEDLLAGGIIEGSPPHGPARGGSSGFPGPARSRTRVGARSANGETARPARSRAGAPESCRRSNVSRCRSAVLVPGVGGSDASARRCRPVGVSAPGRRDRRRGARPNAGRDPGARSPAILTVLIPARVGTGEPSVVDTAVVADTSRSAPGRRSRLAGRPSSADRERRCVQRRRVRGPGTRDLVALDAGDDAVGPYLTPDGALDLAYWRIVGLPTGGEDVEWLEIEQDGVYDRVELRVGRRVLSLRRPAARTEAPWELWRLRNGSSPVGSSE